MDIKLEDYKKSGAGKSDLVSTSVCITEGQKEFVDSNNINLSQLVRDVLAKLMDANKKGKKMKQLLILFILVITSSKAVADSIDVGFIGVSAHAGAPYHGWNQAKRKISDAGKVVWNPELNATYEHKGWLFNTTYLNDCNGYDAYYVGLGYRWMISETFSASAIVGGIYHKVLDFNKKGQLNSMKYKLELAPMISLQKDFMFTKNFGAFTNISSNYFLTHAFVGLKTKL